LCSWERQRKVTRHKPSSYLPDFSLPSLPSLPPSSSGFKAILDNSEIQHRVLEELPILGAIEGFNKIRGNRQLSDKDVREGGEEEGGKEGREGGRFGSCYLTLSCTHTHTQTRNGFVEGMENLMTLAQDAFINKVRCLPPFLPPSFSKCPPFNTFASPDSLCLFVRSANQHSLPPSLPPSSGERPGQSLGDGREDGLLRRPFDQGRKGGRTGRKEGGRTVQSA